LPHRLWRCACFWPLPVTLNKHMPPRTGAQGRAWHDFSNSAKASHQHRVRYAPRSRLSTVKCLSPGGATRGTC
jgi:hypothetical protein